MTKELLTLDDLTPEIEARIPQYLNDYTAGIYDGGRYNSFSEEAAAALINWNYEQAGFKKPVLLVAENPYEAQIYFNYIRANEEYYLPIIHLLYCLDNDLELDFLEDVFEDGKLDGKLRDKLYDKLDDNIQLEYLPDYLFTANIWSNAYGAYYKFIKDEFKIEIQELGMMLDSWNDLYQKSGVYSAIFSEYLCIVSKYPKKILIDENDEMHCVVGPAIEWGYDQQTTAFDCYYIHGRPIEKDVFEKALSGKLTQKEFISQSNDEIRSAWFEILGQEKMLNLLGAELVDSTQVVHRNGEIETIEFYRTKENLNTFRNEPYAWRKVTCPSTGTTYFTPTNPHLDTAIDVAKFHRPEWVPKSVDYAWYSRS